MCECVFFPKEDLPRKCFTLHVHTIHYNVIESLFVCFSFLTVVWKNFLKKFDFMRQIYEKMLIFDKDET